MPLATTRIEHIRVSAHAYQARILAQALQAASKPSTALAEASSMVSG